MDNVENVSCVREKKRNSVWNFGYGRALLAGTVLCVCACVSPLYAESGEEPKNTQNMEHSIAKIKGELRQNSSEKSNPVKEGIPRWGSDDSEEISSPGWRVLKGLGLCVGLLLIGASVIKRLHNPAGSPTDRRISVLERVSVGSKTSLLLVEVDGKTVLTSVGPESVSFMNVSNSENFKNSLDVVCEPEVKLSA